MISEQDLNLLISLEKSNSLNEFVLKNFNLFNENMEGYVTDFICESLVIDILNKFESEIISECCKSDSSVNFQSDICCYSCSFADIEKYMLEIAIRSLIFKHETI